ncbi:MAG TPA: choice-of-anchor Q domain-containing protein [Chloroflexota bacterium]|nr:choice-of-anchor Q domain-containing protein [Chloroflexota bacterium]
MKKRLFAVAAASTLLVVIPLAALPADALASGSTLYVNGSGTATTGCTQASPCETIGEALSEAHTQNASTPGSVTTISIAGSNGSFNGIYCEQLTVDDNLTLIAADPTNQPVVDGGGSGSSCTGETAGTSVVTIGADGNAYTVTIQSLTIQNGDASTDSNNQGEGGGAAILNGSTLTLNSSTVTTSVGCSAAGCATSGGSGGGIYVGVGSTLVLDASTVSHNSGCAGAVCTSGYGGGIYSDYSGVVDATNSTIANNIACDTTAACAGTNPAEGGGLYFFQSYGSMVNATVSANTACGTGTCSGQGGGFFTDAGNLTLSNSILDGNGTSDSSGNCSPSNSVSDGQPNGTDVVGNNVVGSGCGLTNGTNGDKVGVNAGLARLGRYGGPTPTMGVHTGTPAVDAGDATTCQYATVFDFADSPFPGPNGVDQRGVDRNATTRGTCDAGAYDAGSDTVTASTYSHLTVRRAHGETIIRWRSKTRQAGFNVFKHAHRLNRRLVTSKDGKYRFITKVKVKHPHLMPVGLHG